MSSLSEEKKGRHGIVTGLIECQVLGSFSVASISIKRQGKKRREEIVFYNPESNAFLWSK